MTTLLNLGFNTFEIKIAIGKARSASIIVTVRAIEIERSAIPDKPDLKLIDENYQMKMND
jgi:hypothetical protein